MRASRVAIGVGAAALLALAAVAAVLLALSAGWQRERLTRALERTASGALDGELHIAALEGPLYPWLELRGVELTSAAGDARVETLRIDGIEVDLRTRHLEIAELRMSGLDAGLRRDPAATQPAVEPADDATPALPLSLHVARVRVTPARVRIVDAGDAPALQLGGALELEIDDLALDREPDLDAILSTLRARASVSGLAGRLGDVELRDAALRAGWARGAWTLEQAHAVLGPGRIDAHGSGTLERIEALRVEGRQLDLAALGPLLPDLPLAGRAQLELDLTGEIDAPSGRARVEARDLRVRDVELGDVGLQIASSDGRNFELTALEAAARGLALESTGQARLERLDDGVRVHDLRLRAGDQQLDVDGGIRAGGVEALRLRAERLDLERLGALAGLDSIGGRLSGSARLDGPLPLPRAELDAHIESARIGAARVERVELAGALDDATASLRLDLRGPAARLELELPRAALLEPASAGGLWRDPELRARLDADALDVSALAALPGVPRGASGTIDAHLELRGAAPWPLASGTLVARALELPDAGAPGALNAALVLDGRALGIDELVIAGEPPTRVSGELTLAGTPQRPLLQIARLEVEGPASVRLEQPVELAWVDGGARFTQLRIAHEAGTLELSGFASTTRVEALHVVSRGVEPGRLLARDDLGGAIDADLRLDGTLPVPSASGTLAWREPRWGEAALDRIDARLESEAGIFRLELDARRDGRDALSARVEAPVRVRELADLMTQREASAELRARGFDLAWLAPLLPRSWRPSGALDADVTLRGEPGGPVPRGELRLEDARFHVALLRQNIGPARARVVIEPDRVRLAPLLVPSRRGSLEVSGSVGYPWMPEPRAELVASLDGFEVRRPGLVETRLHGELALDGPLEAPSLRGDVELREARVQLPEADDRLAREIRVIGLDDDVTRDASATGAPLASWDVTVRVPRGTWVRGLGANVELEGGLSATSEAGAPPRYAGAMRVVRGTYRLEGRTFEIQQGVAAFTGSTELDPQIHLVALRRVRDVTIIAVLSGWSSDPQLELQSEPPLPRDDLLAYLIFGRPAGQLGGTESQALTSVAGQMAGRMAMDRFSGLLLERLPIDTLELEMSGEKGPTLGVGKYVRDDVFVRYQQTIEGEDVEVEWQVAPEISVQSEISSDGTGGADVIWSRDY